MLVTYEDVRVRNVPCSQTMTYYGVLLRYMVHRLHNDAQAIGGNATYCFGRYGRMNEGERYLNSLAGQTLTRGRGSGQNAYSAFVPNTPRISLAC